MHILRMVIVASFIKQNISVKLFSYCIISQKLSSE